MVDLEATRTWGRDEARSIPSIAGTREKLIEKHFRAGEEQARGDGDGRASFFYLSSEREVGVRCCGVRNERRRATRRKKALTTKANMVGNERAASIFSVP